MPNVSVYYTRHCNTIENLLSKSRSDVQGFTDDKIEKPSKVNISANYNPSLSNFGIAHGLHTISKYNFDKNINPDVVCGSYYVRTWQTAFILYNAYFKNGGTLYILPHIHEYQDGAAKSPEDLRKYMMEEQKYCNIRRSMKDFVTFILHLKQFMKSYYPHLYKRFTFTIPKIVFYNKNGKPISLQKACNLNYYKKFIYIYEHDFNIFEKEIIPKFVNSFDKKITTLGIVIHGSIMIFDVIKAIDPPKDIKAKTIRKVDDSFDILNCDTYLVKYKVLNKSASRTKDTLYSTQIYPYSKKNIQNDHFNFPYFNVKIDFLRSKKFMNPLVKILVKKKMVLHQKDKKMVLGLYHSDKEVVKYFNYILSYYKKCKNSFGKSKK